MRALGDSAGNKNSYQFDKPNPSVLESFKTPLSQTGNSGLCIQIDVPEFTSLCPKTGQPDFATIRIAYRPQHLCIESKSLKLYLMGYRNHGGFHEECVSRIMEDLVRVLSPLYLRVRGEFTPRGGIPFWPTATYTAPGHVEQTLDR